jgi:hypothetical protein
MEGGSAAESEVILDRPAGQGKGLGAICVNCILSITCGLQDKNQVFQKNLVSFPELLR